uniref:disintegrin and metalloproteinase domain-containing protein 15 n=1 Tax=Euleptes europaea TaxID=460621 RepID=UPI00253FB580|nr:disintegrin and metalloproteinase domain-containing protein 15 [Euleptes europaea]
MNEKRSSPVRTDGRVWQPWDELACHWPIALKIRQGNRTLSLEEAALGQNGFPARLQVTLEVEGDRFLVDLERNWELLAGAKGLAYYLPDGTRAIHRTSPEENCCYRGSIEGFLESWANICICSGLSGLLAVSRERSYSLESRVKGNVTDHRAYRLRAVRHGTGECRPVSLSHGQLHSQPEQPLLRRGKRQAEPEHGYVELVMVADHAEFELYFDLNQVQMRMLEIASHMDGFYRPLGLRVALVSGEVWNKQDQVSMEGHPHVVLERFLRWRQQALLPKVPHDSAQLITQRRRHPQRPSLPASAGSPTVCKEAAAQVCRTAAESRSAQQRPPAQPPFTKGAAERPRKRPNCPRHARRRPQQSHEKSCAVWGCTGRAGACVGGRDLPARFPPPSRTLPPFPASPGSRRRSLSPQKPVMAVAGSRCGTKGKPWGAREEVAGFTRGRPLLLLHSPKRLKLRAATAEPELAPAAQVGGGRWRRQPGSLLCQSALLTPTCRQRGLSMPSRAHVPGSPLTGGMTGVSTHASICSRRSGGISMDHSVSPLVMASTLSHQLGHNLGLSHDGASCGCDGSSPNLPPGRSCIMEPPGLLPGLSFSRCSRQQLQEILQSNRVWCLRDVPEPTRLTKPRCGNHLVESGEECDCGLRQECTDPCCDAITCQLVPGAQCATGGGCCHKCKLRGAGFVCRGAQKECDLPEFCDGVSPRCPTNVHKQDGTPCAEGEAICYGGACPTYLGQCQELWGPGSVPVSDACMASLNGRGDLEGHCGQHLNGSYVSCAHRNSRCGRLQCQGGSANLTKQNKVGASPACPHNTPSPADDVLDLAMVLPGTACGPDKFCIDQRCQDLPALKFPVCLCNGHGVCNNQGNCHCQPGWAPPDCRNSGRGGSVDSGSPAVERGSATSTALILSSLLLVLLLVFGLYFAKRVGLHKRLCQLGKGTSCQYSAEAESRVQFLHPSEQRGITQPEPRSYSRAPPERPQPPQWRQSSELQLMPSSKPTPLDDTRPDPPSKPLPPDPIPKGQQAAATDRPVPPTRPLPADPIPKAAQPPGPAKPPPPRKPLPSDPPRTEPSAVPTYSPQVLMLPPRPPPPPPPPPTSSAGLPTHVQEA